MCPFMGLCPQSDASAATPSLSSELCFPSLRCSSIPPAGLPKATGYTGRAESECGLSMKVEGLKPVSYFPFSFHHSKLSKYQHL